MNAKTPAMIPRLVAAGHTPDWQRQLAGAIRTTGELLEYLELAPATTGIAADTTGFPLRVPHAFADRMRRGDPHDPLLRQVLPVAAELDAVDGFSNDPLQELDSMPSPGLLHKYRGRALLTVTGACAVHCRYCFRRHFPYSDANQGPEHRSSLDYLETNPDVHEVILSGGDPLTLSNERLTALSAQLSGIRHLRILRIHTRLPVVLPARIDSGLLDCLQQQRMQVVMVIHCNHPQELDDAVDDGLQRLAAAGVTLLNQSVLLRGINDDADVLADLSERLFAAGVLPYYLHQLDRVKGAAHFEVPDLDATRLHRQLRERLSGYLVPRLVREIAGAGSKTPVPFTDTVTPG